jgi:hypothetical protein
MDEELSERRLVLRNVSTQKNRYRTDLVLARINHNLSHSIESMEVGAITPNGPLDQRGGEITTATEVIGVRISLK